MNIFDAKDGTVKFHLKNYFEAFSLTAEEIQELYLASRTSNSNTHQNDEDVISIHTTGLTEAIRCSLCKNPIGSDQGCDGGCMVDEQLVTRIISAIEEHKVMTPEMIRCKDCGYLVEGDNGEWICDDCQKEIHTIPYDCSANRKW